MKSRASLNAPQRADSTVPGMLTAGPIKNRSKAIARAFALAAVLSMQDERAFVDYLEVACDYLSYLNPQDTGASFSLGSIELYVLSWCEEPTDFVIDTLLRMHQLTESELDS